MTEIKISKNKEYTDKWIKEGNIIPKCINSNCNNNVLIRHWSIQGIPSLKTECGKCAKYRINGKTMKNIIVKIKIVYLGLNVQWMNQDIPSFQVIFMIWII